MRFAGRVTPDFPAPPGIDEVGRRFSVPIMVFAAQPSLEVWGVGETGHGSVGEPTIVDSVSCTFTLWRDPTDHANPINLAELTPFEREQLDQEPVAVLPQWMLDIRERMRYPTLWEAVTTTIIEGNIERTVDEILVDHVNHILINRFRAERVSGENPGVLDAPASPRHVRPWRVRVDGADLSGIAVDTDPHVFGIAADLGNRRLTAVIPRDFLPLIDVAFMSLA